MTKLSAAERWVFLLTLIFLLATFAWFFTQNGERDLTRVVVEKPPEAVSAVQETEPVAAPGILDGERININTAAVEDLMRLPSIGEVRAKDIVAYREAKGPFGKPEDIQEVSGIGEKTCAKLSPYICVSDERPAKMP